MLVSSIIQTSKPKVLSWVGTPPSPTPAQTRLLHLPSWLPLLTATKTAGSRWDDPFTTQQAPREQWHPGPAFQPGLEDFPHFSTPALQPLRAKRASPAEQPHPAPPSPAPRLATWKSTGVSQAQGEGSDGAKQIPGQKTNWPKLLVAPTRNFPKHPPRPRAGRPAWEIPSSGSEGRRSGEPVGPEGWRRLSAPRRWVGGGWEPRSPAGRGGKGGGLKRGVGKGPAIPSWH